MRDVEAVDNEIRLVALVRRSIVEQGGPLTSTVIDQLLDERNRIVST
ncbi:hypothetical protein [Mycobacterium sp. GA-1285]|nr:hypothetical protein [Mycobacterium sp. GA-1285]